MSSTTSSMEADKTSTSNISAFSVDSSSSASSSPISSSQPHMATVVVTHSAPGPLGQSGISKRYRAIPAKTFQCRGYGDCRMVFSRSEHLARHVRKHTGERPFACHCTKQFSRLDNLRQHAQTVHADRIDENERMMRELTSLHATMAAAHKATTARARKAAASLSVTSSSPSSSSSVLVRAWATKEDSLSPLLPPMHPTQLHPHSLANIRASASASPPSGMSRRSPLQHQQVSPAGTIPFETQAIPFGPIRPQQQSTSPFAPPHPHPRRPTALDLSSHPSRVSPPVPSPHPSVHSPFQETFENISDAQRRPPQLSTQAMGEMAIHHSFGVNVDWLTQMQAVQQQQQEAAVGAQAYRRHHHHPEMAQSQSPAESSTWAQMAKQANHRFPSTHRQSPTRQQRGSPISPAMQAAPGLHLGDSPSWSSATTSSSSSSNTSSVSFQNGQNQVYPPFREPQDGVMRRSHLLSPTESRYSTELALQQQEQFKLEQRRQREEERRFLAMQQQQQQQMAYAERCFFEQQQQQQQGEYTPLQEYPDQGYHSPHSQPTYSPHPEYQQSTTAYDGLNSLMPSAYNVASSADEMEMANHMAGMVKFEDDNMS